MGAEMSGRRPRKAIPKKLRFEIFKRDGFACVYCGRGSKERVALELDHIEAHAAGGSDDETNLVTACRDCNGGKSDRPLDAALPRMNAETVDEMRERVEQMKAYREWRAEFDHELRRELDAVWQAWIDEFGGSLVDGEYTSRRVPFPTEAQVLEYLADLPTSEVVDAVRIAAWKWRTSDDFYGPGVSRYFVGVLRNKLRRAEEDRQRIAVSWDDLVSAVPALGEIFDEVARFSPLRPWHFCGDRVWKNGWTVHLAGGVQREVDAPHVRVAALVGPKSGNRHHPVLGTHTALDVALRTCKAVVPLCGQTCTCGRPKRPPRAEDFPRCPVCQQVTEPIDQRESCEAYPTEWMGREYPAVPFGLEGWVWYGQIAERRPGRYQRLESPVTWRAKPRCVECRAPEFGFHHPGCQFQACAVCGERADSGCGARGHAAPQLEVSGRQAMARLAHMK